MRARRGVMLLLVAATACSTPWKNERRDEINIAFVLKRNQPVITADIGNRRGSFVVASAQPRSILDPAFLQNRRVDGNSRVVVALGERQRIRITPAPVAVRPLADGILGTDFWRGYTMTIDYRGRAIALSDRPLPMDDMTRYRFSAIPRAQITIDGTSHSAIVDTAVPDTLLLPEKLFGKAGRRRVAVTIAGLELRDVDVEVGPTSEIRIGNRILANFLVVIDYRRGVVGLWRDPR